MQVIVNADLYSVACNENKTSLPVFYTPAWLDTVMGPNQWQPCVIVEEAIVKAIFPICVKRKFGFKAIIMPPLTPYLALWLFDQNNTIQYESYLTVCLQQLPSALVTSISPHHSYSNTSVWLDQGYEIAPKNTFTFNYQPYETIYQNYPAPMKRDLKRANEKLTIQEQSHADDLYAMLCHTFTFQKMKTPVAKALIIKIIENPEFNAKVYSASFQNKIVASIMTISDQSWTYYLLSGRSKEAPHGAVALLIDHAIKSAINQQHHFDFEGSSIEGIANFFKSFGPQHKPYFHAQKFKNGIIKKLRNLQKAK